MNISVTLQVIFNTLKFLVPDVQSNDIWASRQDRILTIFVICGRYGKHSVIKTNAAGGS